MTKISQISIDANFPFTNEIILIRCKVINPWKPRFEFHSIDLFKIGRPTTNISTRGHVRIDGIQIETVYSIPGNIITHVVFNIRSHALLLATGGFHDNGLCALLIVSRSCFIVLLTQCLLYACWNDAIMNIDHIIRNDMPQYALSRCWHLMYSDKHG